MNIYLWIVVISVVVMYTVYTRYREYVDSVEDRIEYEFEYPDEYERETEYRTIDLRGIDYTETRYGEEISVYRTADGCLHRAISAGKVRIDVAGKEFQPGVYRVKTRDGMNILGMVTENDLSSIKEY